MPPSSMLPLLLHQASFPMKPLEKYLSSGQGPYYTHDYCMIGYVNSHGTQAATVTSPVFSTQRPGRWGQLR